MKRKGKQLGHVTIPIMIKIEKRMQRMTQASVTEGEKGNHQGAYSYLERAAGMQILADDLGAVCRCPLIPLTPRRTRVKCFCAHTVTDAERKEKAYLKMTRRIRS